MLVLTSVTQVTKYENIVVYRYFDVPMHISITASGTVRYRTSLIALTVLSPTPDAIPTAVCRTKPYFVSILSRSIKLRLG